MATQKQIRVAKIVSENVRKSVSAAMREVGYSKRSAEKPQRLTRSKGWRELMAEQLPDETLLSVHKGLLQHPDWRAREAGLDRAYKLKGLYKPEKFALTDRVGEMTLEELDAEIARIEPLLERSRMHGKRKNTVAMVDIPIHP